MIKRSLLWVLAAYCIGIVFRDRLKWMLWAVLFSCIILRWVMLKNRYFLMFLLFVSLSGAFFGKKQEADYPIDAVLKEKKVASAEGRIRSITETKSGYRLELKPMRIELSDSVRKPDSESLRENVNEQTVFTRGKLLVYCPSAEGLKIGNYIRLEGKAVPLAEPENAGQFDERAYYRAERICCKFNADRKSVV